MNDLEYKKLLAEVLGRVNERDTSKEVEIDVSDFPDNIPNKEKKVKNLEDLYKMFVAAGKKDPATMDNLAALADETAADEILSDADIIAALKKPNDSAEHKLVKHMQSLGISKISKRISQIENELFTGGALEMGQLQASDIDDKGDQVAASPFATPSLDDVQSTQIGDTDVFRDFNTFVASAPQSVIDQFKAVGGTGLRGKFQELSKFGEAIKGGKATIDVWVKENGAFKFMNYAPAYLSLVDMAKKLSGNEAGYGFEKYIALLLASPVVGGSNGAADNIGALTTGRKVFMSAKMLDFPSVRSISQALKSGNPDGIEGVVKVKGEPIFYLSILKGQTGTTGSTGFNVMRLYLHKVYWHVKKEEYRVTLLNADGGEVKDYKADIKMKKDTDTPDRILIFAPEDTPGVLDNKKIATFTLPVPSIKDEKGTEQLLSLTSEYVAGLVPQLADNLIQKLSSIYTSLELMKKNTRSFIAQKSGGESKMDYVEKISSLYKQVYTSYNDATQGDEQHVFGDDKVSKAMGLTKDGDDKLSESIGISEIRELTKNILKEMLDDE